MGPCGVLREHMDSNIPIDGHGPKVEANASSVHPAMLLRVEGGMANDRGGIVRDGTEGAGKLKTLFGPRASTTCHVGPAR